MKYAFLILAFLASFSAFAQPAVTLKPGRTDSARWELTRELVDGTTVQNIGPGVISLLSPS